MAALPKPARITNLSRLAFARSLGCIVAGRVDECRGRIEAHHVIFEGHGRTGSKVSDFSSVGACTHHHALAGRRDWFEERYSILFFEEISRINAAFYAQSRATKPKRERQPITPKLEHVRIRCTCKQSHDVKKVDYDEAGMTYYCRVKRQNFVIPRRKR
jgi:hypothetical protein